MPPLPPLKDTLDALQHCVLPGAGGAALVMGLFLLIGRWTAATGSGVAVVLAFLWGNFTLDYVGSDPPRWGNTGRVLPWMPGENAPGYQWLPYAAFVLVLVGLVSRWVGLAVSRILPERGWWGANVAVWLPRAGAVIAVSAWLVLGKAAQGPEWAGLRWYLAAAILFIWFVLDRLARGGLSADVSAYLGAMFFAGAVVLLYSHNAKFMELAVILGSAMFGIALMVGLVQQYAPSDGTKLLASGAIPAAVVFLPGLLLGTRPSHAENKVPVVSFWLTALAPLILAPFLIPRVCRQNRWLLLALRVVLVMAPLVIAVVLAGQHEKFPFEEEPEW